VVPVLVFCRAGVKMAGRTSGNPLQARGLKHGTMVGSAGTFVPFQESREGTIFVNEQFWGRAARAS